MPRKNRNPHPRRPLLSSHYDLDYVSLPEHPQYIRIIVKAYKTVFVNLDADFDADAEYVVSRKDDPILRKIERRIGLGEVIA